MSLNSLLFFRSNQPRAIWVLFFGWLTSNFAFAMIVPFIGIYFLDVLKVSPGQVGIFFAIATISRSVSQLISGELSDRYGRRRLMYWGQYLRGFTFLMVVPCIYFNLGYFTVSLVLYINYFFGGIYQTVGNAAISDVTTPEKRLEAFSFTRIGGNLGWALGPATGGFLSVFGYELLFFIASVLSVLSAYFIFRLMDKDHFKNSASEKLTLSSFYSPLKNDRPFLIFNGAALLLFICVGQIISTFAVFSHQVIGLSNADLGLIFSINGSLIVLFQLAISDISKKYDLFNVVALGSLVFGISYSFVGILSGFWWVAFIMVFITLAEMMTMPTGNAIISILAPKNNQGRYMGIYSLLTSISWSLAPVLGTGMMELKIPDLWLWIIIGSFGFFATFGFLHSRKLFHSSKRITNSL